MQRGKIINIETLLPEISGYEEEIKENLLKIFDFVYKVQGWTHEKDKLPRNKVNLYKYIEDLLK